MATLGTMKWLDDVKWDAQGLVPVIAQEVGSNDVLMFAFMNREALQQTALRGEAVYWSRSRNRATRKPCTPCAWTATTMCCCCR
jgi:phosphoribosyl-AMP cyclohydrolase